MANISQFGPAAWWEHVSEECRLQLRQQGAGVLSPEIAEAIHAAGGMTVKTDESGADWSTLRDEDWQWIRRQLEAGSSEG